MWSEEVSLGRARKTVEAGVLKHHVWCCPPISGRQDGDRWQSAREDGRSRARRRSDRRMCLQAKAPQVPEEGAPPPADPRKGSMPEVGMEQMR